MRHVRGNACNLFLGNKWDNDTQTEQLRQYLCAPSTGAVKELDSPSVNPCDALVGRCIALNHLLSCKLLQVIIGFPWSKTIMKPMDKKPSIWVFFNYHSKIRIASKNHQITDPHLSTPNNKFVLVNRSQCLSRTVFSHNHLQSDSLQQL